MSIRWAQCHTDILKAETFPATEWQRDATYEESLAVVGLEDEEGAMSQGLRSLWKLEKKPPEEPALTLGFSPDDHVGLMPSSLYSSHKTCTHCTCHFQNCLLRAQGLVSELTTMAL